MENIEALTAIMVLIALGAGIIIAHIMPVGVVASALVAAFYLQFLYFSPLTSTWFARTLVDGLGTDKQALAIAASMIASFGLAAAATFAYNLLTGRIRGDGLPPAV